MSLIHSREESNTNTHTYNKCLTLDKQFNIQKFTFFDNNKHPKNGIENIDPIESSYQKGQPIKIIHQCTPWRGLSVLLGAMQLVKNPLISLDVYSSCEVYGKDFAEANDKHYEALYEQARQLPNVNYIGYKPNEYIKEHLKDYRLFVYPSIWEETFCISALEAMAAGLYCITTNYGALFETCSEFPMYIPYSNDYKSLAKKFASGIEIAGELLEAPGIQDHLDLQKKFVNRFYDWKVKGTSWTRFFTRSNQCKITSLSGLIQIKTQKLMKIPIKLLNIIK